MDKRRVYPASGARIGRHVVVVGRSFAFRVRSAVHKLAHNALIVVAFFRCDRNGGRFPRPPSQACAACHSFGHDTSDSSRGAGIPAISRRQRDGKITDFSLHSPAHGSLVLLALRRVLSVFKFLKMTCARRSCLILSVCDANPVVGIATRRTCRRPPRKMKAILMGSVLHTKDRYLDLLWSTNRQTRSLQPRVPRDIATDTSSREHSPDIQFQRPIGNCRHASPKYVPPSRARRPLATIDQIC